MNALRLGCGKSASSADYDSPTLSQGVRGRVLEFRVGNCLGPLSVVGVHNHFGSSNSHKSKNSADSNTST